MKTIKLAKNTGKTSISILDQANRMLKQFSFTQSHQYKLSVRDLVPGTYIIQIKQNGLINSLKLEKR